MFKLKGVQLSPSLEVIAVAEVKFDSDLPEYRTTGGVNQGKGQNELEIKLLYIMYNC